MRADRLLRLLTTAVLVAVLVVAASGPARADDIVAIDTSTISMVPSAGAVTAPAISAVASRPRTIVVSNHGQRPISLYAKGERRRSITPHSTAPVRFAGLTAGRTYVVVVGGAELGRLAAIDRPLAATGLTVRLTSDPDALALTWQHRTSTTTGGSAVWYDVTATSPGAATMRTRVTRTRATTLTGLDRSALYTFTVAPHNSAGTGPATTARMTATLAALRPTAPTAAPTPTPTPTPVPTPTPTPTAPPAPANAPAPAGPSTRTVYVCPSGSTETATHTCQIVKAYTFTTKAYTYHDKATGSAPILDEYSTTVRACPGGYNLEDYGWVIYCRRYGAVPTTTVKDDVPAGYTDDGTRWIKKDPVPDGYADDGTQWVKTVAKVAQIVPA